MRCVYHYGNRTQAELTQRPETFSELADHFFTTFPQLEPQLWVNRNPSA